MKYILTYLTISFHIFAFGQDTVFFHVNPEKSPPYDEYSKYALNHKVWYVNSTEIPYKKGVYGIPLHRDKGLDTIEIITIFQSTEYFIKPNNRRAKPVNTIDTVSQNIVAQFRKEHNYSLSQVFPGDFSVFSLDTFNIEQHLQINISGHNRKDTLFLHYNHNKPIKVFSDTTIILNDHNKKMDNNLIAALELNNREVYLNCGQDPNPNYNLIYRLDYVFLHGEKLSVNIDLETNEINLQTNYVANTD